MSQDVWEARDTTPSQIEAALRELLVRAYSTDDAIVAARVLNVVVIVDAEFKGEVENRLERVGRYHPSRLILCSVRPGRERLDARASMVADGGAMQGSLAVARERVEIEIGPQHLRTLDTIVDPLLVSDLATVVWAPHGHREGVDALQRLAQVVLIDSHDEPDLEVALCRAHDLAEDSYVVDLAWLRSTPWRERVAAAFDPPMLRPHLREISGLTVRHRSDSEAAAMLFCGWLASRLGWRAERLTSRGDEIAGRLRTRRGEVRVRLEPSAELRSPGLGGVTLDMASGAMMSLDRGPGGLQAVRRGRKGPEQRWTVLGASRGEGGILGEGVRQALLRDPTYRPALDAARAMVR
ncbi:MAG: glucose-6-phosphate dehydrogenase assembly protein OpcA [Solirubrobacterales bacterium]|nr:glucose-6-phosphate dehydrogenase assembly protein OpcA [Solirubrobacterales bacterium]